jgi:hypothetical protein
LYRHKKDPSSPGSRFKAHYGGPTAILWYLFNLGFFEYHMLADDGVELLELELSGLGPRILFRDVVEAGVGAADQLYQDGIRLGHEMDPAGLGVTWIGK